MANIRYQKYFDHDRMHENDMLDAWVYHDTIATAELFRRIIQTNTLRMEFIPVKVIAHDPATIFFWRDGTKTVVKLSENDHYDFANAYANAVMKKIFGNSAWSKHAEKVLIDQSVDDRHQKPDSERLMEAMDRIRKAFKIHTL